MIRSLTAETVDKKYLKTIEEKKEIVFTARSVSRARALLNSVLYSAYAVTQTIAEVEGSGRRSSS